MGGYAAGSVSCAAVARGKLSIIHCQFSIIIIECRYPSFLPGLYKEENKTADVSQFRAGKTNNDIQ